MAEDRTTMDVVRESKSLAYVTGVITLVAGLVLLFWPDRTITVVARLSGLLLVIVGLADLWDALRNHRTQPYTGLLIVRAVLNLGFGAALLFWSDITLSVIVWLVGLDLVLTGLLGLLVRSRMAAEYQSGMLVRSLVTIGFGIVVMIWPSATLTVIAILVGASLALFGLVMLWSGYQVGKLGKEMAAG